MRNLIFRISVSKEIVVTHNGQLLFKQNWHDEMTLEENIIAAMKVAKRLLDEMGGQGKRAGEAGENFKEKYYETK